MTPVVPVSDAAIRAMLVRRAHRTDPAGLEDAAFAVIDATQPRRGPRLAWPRPAWPAALVPDRAPRQLAWLIAAAALLLALVSGTLIAGSLLKPRLPADHARLVPTGIEILSPDAALYDRVFEDGSGVLWAFRTGHLTRFSADGGEHRTWTLADDAAFGGWPVAAAARAGGVWLWDGVTVRRFDGSTFAEAFEGPPGDGAAYLAEAPDGSLWAETWDGRLARRDGSSWIAAPTGPELAGGGLLLALGRDEVWASSPQSAGSPGSISHLVGGRWATYGPEHPGLAGGSIGSIVAAADGSIWVTANLRLARFDGRSWTEMDDPGFPAWLLEPAPDGSVWAVTGEASTLAVARYRNGLWTTYGRADGLEGTQLGHISVTTSGTFLATDAGLFRFDNDRWTRVFPEVAAGPVTAGPLLAVAAGEAWAADDRGTWHYVDGAWAGPMQLGDLAGARTAAFAMAPDGTPWAATDQGVAFLRAGRWITAWRQAALSIDVAPDGMAWAGAGTGIVGLRTDGSRPRTVPCPNATRFLAATTDGAVYVGSFAYGGSPGLARSDGRTCETVDPLHDGGRHEVVSLAADPAGGLVALILEGLGDGGGGDGWSSHLVRSDGTRWTVLEEQAKVPGVPYDVFFAPSGGLWRADMRAGGGLARFVDGRWVTVADVEVAGPVSVAPDGTVWIWTPSGVARLRPPASTP